MQLTFSTGDVLAASSVPNATFQSWNNRNDLIFPTDQVAGGVGAGNHRRFSLAAFLQVVVGAEINRMGIAPAQAFRAAAKFAYFGNSTQDGQHVDRRPGYPYHWSRGRTLLIMPAGNAEQAKVILIKKDEKLPLWDVPQLDGKSPASFAVVDVLSIFERAVESAGFISSAMMNDAYGWKAEQAKE